MSCLLGCCCLRSSELDTSLQSNDERQPLLPAVSARQIPSVATAKKTGEMAPKNVGIPELNRTFEDIAVMFNEQQKNYKAMTEHIKSLRESYQCSPGDSFSVCINTMRDEHGQHGLGLQMKGYDFSLVLPLGTMPDKLQQAQEAVRSMCQATKAIIAVAPRLQELISWVLNNQEVASQSVLEVSSNFLEQRRVEANLKENLEEVHRARELSRRHKQEANALLKEVAQLTGVSLNQ